MTPWSRLRVGVLVPSRAALWSELTYSLEDTPRSTRYGNFKQRRTMSLTLTSVRKRRSHSPPHGGPRTGPADWAGHRSGPWERTYYPLRLKFSNSYNHVQRVANRDDSLDILRYGGLCQSHLEFQSGDPQDLVPSRSPS